ncbi:MAG: hypothetical protein JO232_18785 [Verrucomicrobia bacterium]|nr:hypothetical protein [Verrucomicrobiota bacterium]
MESIFDKVCVLVTAAFALTLVPGFRRSESSLLSVRDRGTALLVFMLLGLAEMCFARSGVVIGVYYAAYGNPPPTSAADRLCEAASFN